MAELALGIVGLTGAIEMSLKVGKGLAAAVKTYRNSDIQFIEICTRVQICWSRIQSQLEVIQVYESGMSEEQKDLQGRIVDILQSKLKAATLEFSKLDKQTRSTTMRKMHFVTLKDTFETAVADLEAWQKRFEPCWFEWVKNAPSSIHGTLLSTAPTGTREIPKPAQEALLFRRAFEPGESGFIKEKNLDNYKIGPISHSVAQLAIESTTNKLHIIDTASTEAVKMKDARKLAHRLRETDPQSFGIMRCKGVVLVNDSEKIAFIFRVPDGFNTARSLRDLLVQERPPASLTIRLEMARQLAMAVYYVHLYEFVHKNICPETILSLSAPAQKDNSVLCLVGFQVLRQADGRTNTAKLERNIYHHPARHIDQRTNYVMQHDIYSLGVCLLEIGLWQSLVAYKEMDDSPEPSAADILKMLSPPDAKDQLVGMSRTILRERMGDKYSKIVETCLTCLDADNADFGNPQEFLDEDGVEVGAWYMKKVLDAMASISF